MADIETTIIASHTDVNIGGGIIAKAETYNGAIPGPTLSLNVGDTVIVRLINLLDHPTGIHWHGIELANSADGTEVTQGPVVPAFTTPPPAPAPAGGTYLYKFKVTRPGIFWYHPHHHNSSNRVFKGLYGMIVVTDQDEVTLANGTVLPLPADTRQIVLSDMTVCQAPGFNIDRYAALAGAEWLSPGATSQPDPTPANLCESPTAVNDDGDTVNGTFTYSAGDIPSLTAASGRINEGQIVLTNGVNVGGRAGTPFAPGALAPGATTLPVLSGQGLRLQIVNCATLRYFRLRLTYNDGVTGQQVPLVRVGGEGGVLDRAVLEGLNPPIPANTFDPEYESGEILLPPSVRADVVAAIPTGLAVGTVLTLWTRDFPRLGSTPQGPWARLPTVPVLHLEVTGAVAGPAYTIVGGPNGVGGTLLRASLPVPPPPDPSPLVETLGAATATLLDPTDPNVFMPTKPGMPNQDIELSSGPPPSINGVPGGPLHGPPPYPNTPHIMSTRYAEKGGLLELTVTNSTDAHHPFHLHGFSFQPKELTRPNSPNSPSYSWLYNEFRDSIDVPSDYTLRFRVRLDDRPLVDGTTLGGWLGRWLFHCHIFFHHHRGMVGEFVVTGDTAGSEKPDVDVGGSWAYAPIPGTATRQGTFFHRDGLQMELTASRGIVLPAGLNNGGNWSWSHTAAIGDPPETSYVYITATDTEGHKDQTVFRLKLGEDDDGADIGDPHIRTVDGTYYDFQAVGEFTLLRDTEGFEVQVRQTPVPTATPIADSHSDLTVCVSINTAVAARIGAHWISYQPRRNGGPLEFFLDGKPAELTPRGIDLEAGRIVAFPAGGATGLRVDYANCTVLTVTPHFWGSYNVWYLNVAVAHTDADQGLMGRIPPQTWLPMLPSGATVGPRPDDPHERYVALYRTFADAWRVTENTSLFAYETGTTTKTFTDPDWPAEKPPCDTVLPQFEIPGANPPLVNISRQTAERICKPVTLDDLHRSCVFDVATTGDKTLVQNYLLDQEIRLAGTAVQIVAGKSPTRPGETVVFTATVSALAIDKRTPTGIVTFLVDDVPVEGPLDLDNSGRASFKTGSLSKGVRRVRAEFTPSGDEGFRGSSSPSLRHPVEDRKAADRSQAPYRLRGIFYEACDCFTICPCWLGTDPDGGECTGVFAWEIENGQVDGADVAGLRVVSVSHHTGSRDEARQRVMIFVDDRAMRRQADALAAAFSGRLGGPLEELSGILGELLGVERAAIELRHEGRLTTLTVDHHIRVEGMATEGPSGRPMVLNDGKLSTVLGSQAAVGESGRFRVGLAARGMEIDVRGRSTMSGRFSYVHIPGQVARGVPGHGG